LELRVTNISLRLLGVLLSRGFKLCTCEYTPVGLMRKERVKINVKLLSFCIRGNIQNKLYFSVGLTLKYTQTLHDLRKFQTLKRI